jgi:two-component system nitrate/nitrite response regulator NarL
LQVSLPHLRNGFAVSGEREGGIAQDSARWATGGRGFEPAPAPRVLIADRDSMSSDLLARALTSGGAFHASGISPRDLPDAVEREHPQVVVIGSDLAFNAKNGIDVARTLRRNHPSVRLVILLRVLTEDLVLAAFRSGARGVFCRQRPLTEFVSCIEYVCRGFIWAGAEEAVMLLDFFRSVPTPDLRVASDTTPLTFRELQVVRCASRGKTNKAIATELGLSEHTVKNHLFRAFEKVGVSNRVELLFYLMQKGLNLSRVTAAPMAPKRRAS